MFFALSIVGYKNPATVELLFRTYLKVSTAITTNTTESVKMVKKLNEHDCADCKHRYKEYCTLFDDLIEYNDLCFMWGDRK